ncbi:MAG: T9SS type B sorting domain-containing protein, partial [Flavobacteriaceae bacterium]
TISGTPSANFSYTISTVNGCGSVTLNGSVSISSNATLTLDSGNNNQNICSGNPIAPIQYTFGGGATSVNVTGLPTGVTATTSGNTVTISGTPSASFSYTIATVNGCGGTSLSGSISLNNYITPTFTPILPMCAGATSSPLPLVSNEGITGIWTPAFNNNTSTNYTFIPDPAQCALTAQMTVQIFPIPTVIATNLAPSFCSGGTTNIQLSSNVSGATFSWTVTGGNVIGADGDTGNSINQLLSVSSGTTSTVEVTYTIIAEANGCAGPPVEVKVQVTPIPDLQIATGTNPICSGETTSISFSGSVPRTVFHWVITGISGITGASNGSGTSIQQALSTTGSSQGSVTYEITPTLNGCIGPSQSITVLVNPRPEMFTNSTHPDICSGDLTNISIGTFNNNTVLTWTVNPVGVNGASSGSNTGLSTTIIQELTTSGNAQGYVDYTITPSLAGCDGTSFTVRVYVNPLPEPKLVDGAICVDASGIPFQTYTLDSGLDNATYDFIWYFNGVAIPNTNNATYTANEVGVYGVVATNSTTNCHSSNGTNMVIANVISVTPATSLTYTQSNYFSGNATVIINITGGTGTLMYSLDDGTFQTSNIFTNLSAGLHTITVIDTQGCTHFTQDIFIIEYPQYFTPNGDGYNDTWFISGLKNTDLISIFDRYGKLIKQLRGEEFWDGTYNQQQLPSTDYWFTVDYLENGVKKLFKAHFAMKR